MKLLKFDTVHPKAYLLKKQNGPWSNEIDSLSREEYLSRIVELRSNFSDFYTYNLNRIGWESEEFYARDPIYIEKVARELYGKFYWKEKSKHRILWKLRMVHDPWKIKVISDYINHYSPDIIFAREHTSIPSDFWQNYRRDKLVVSRISSIIPKKWSPHDFDLIYTDIPEYTKFFEFNKIKTLDSLNGFDSRILNDLKDREKQLDVGFIGGIDKNIFKGRAELMTEIAATDHIDFKWWGYRSNDLSKSLNNTYQGVLSGLEMYQVYKDSKIVINDYGEVAGGIAVNQRLYETMGVGSFLLTRESWSLDKIFGKNLIVTFSSAKDCLDKINYYLKNETEREDIAKETQKMIFENFEYKDLMKKMSRELTIAFNQKNDNK